MKFRNLMLSMIAASALMLATASCGDDSDEATPSSGQAPQDAVYKGTYALTATAMGQTMTATNDTTGIKVAYAGNGKLSITLPATELKETHSLFPSATVEVSFETGADGTITIAETAFETAPDSAGKTCKGTLGGKICNDKMELSGTESYGSMPVVCAIIFPYEAKLSN